MKRKDVFKLIFCSVMAFNLTANAVVRAEETNSTTVNATETQPVENTEAQPQPEATSNTNVGATAEESNVETAGVEANVNESTDANNGAVTGEEAQPQPVVAAENSAEKNYNKMVSRIGQWTGESRVKQDDQKQFANADDKLGDPISNPGLYRGNAKTFLGWSDKAPVKNGEIVDGARFFSKEDKISDVFPNGIPDDAKIYAVYFSLNEPDAPFPDDKIGMGLALISGMEKLKLDNNSITISGNEVSSEKLQEENSGENKVTKIYKYEKKDDKKNINEVKLESEFKMPDNLAMIVYKNPGIGYGYNKVFTRNYPDKFANGDFEVEDEDYTYVDLNVELDERLTIPENLYLEFEGYSWRPLYVFGTDKDGNKRELLEVLNPENDSSLGKDKNSFSSLVKNNSPKVTFGVKTNEKKNFTIRTIVRHNDFVIEESSVKPVEGKSIAETILQNMKLKALSTDEIVKVNPNKKELNNSVIKISDEEAKKLTLENAKEIEVKGNIKGLAVPDAGPIGSGWLTFPSKAKLPISSKSSNIIAIRYKAAYNEFYEFKSSVDKEELPDAVKNLKPANVTDNSSENGKEVKLEMYKNVTVGEDIWRFNGWKLKKSDNTETDLSPNETGEVKATIDFEDLHLIGIWENVKLISHEFVSGTEGKVLPKEVLDKLPKNFEESKGKKVSPKPDNFDPVKVSDGTWTFKGWNEKGEYTVAENHKFIGTWVFEKSETPVLPIIPFDPVVPTPQPEPTPQPQPEPNKPIVEEVVEEEVKPNKPNKTPGTRPSGKVLPKTSVASTSIATAIMSLAGVVLFKRKRK